MSLEPLHVFAAPGVGSAAAAFGTRCGHAFDPTSIVRVILAAAAREGPARCPFCALPLALDELRPAAVVVAAPPAVGIASLGGGGGGGFRPGGGWAGKPRILRFRLLAKAQGSAAPPTVMASSSATAAAAPVFGGGSWRYSRVSLATPDSLGPLLDVLSGGVAAQLAEACAGGSGSSGDGGGGCSGGGGGSALAEAAAAEAEACLAAQQLIGRWRERWARGAVATGAEATGDRLAEATEAAPEGRSLYLYQLDDGQRAFLHPLNVKVKPPPSFFEPLYLPQERWGGRQSFAHTHKKNTIPMRHRLVH